MPLVPTVTLLVTMLGAWLTAQGSPPATGRDQPRTVDVRIRVITCEPVALNASGTVTDDSIGCVRADGVAIDVSIEAGQPLGSCVTGQIRPGWGDCVLQAPSGTDVLIIEDVGTLPPGYRPRENPTRAFVFDFGTGVDVVNFRADLAATMPIQPLVPVQGKTASLTIHHRACPAGFEGPDYFRECHGAPTNGMPFLIEGLGYPREVETLADGNVIVADLSPSTYTVRGGPPDRLVRNAIFCAPAANPGLPYSLIQVNNVEISLDVLASQDVICDWYSVPHNLGNDALLLPAWSPPIVDQTLTVSGMLCPQGYGGSDYVTDCSGVPAAGAFFQVSARNPGGTLPRVGFATADADGTVTFALDALAPGPIFLHAIVPADVPIPGGFTVPLVSCTAGAARAPLPIQFVDSRAVGQIVEIELEDDDVLCAVYFLPLASSE